jgi:hypothetical protein
MRGSLTELVIFDLERALALLDQKSEIKNLIMTQRREDAVRAHNAPTA